MRKSEALNTFAGGMIMDINPLVTPNDVLVNALNATLVTFNGNENVLQNDMGNGRVETAYLPEGYVPVGTAELGGIIYIVSYNPLIDKCQVGSFPSPERNITSDEIQTPNVFVSNDQFQTSNSVTGGQMVKNVLLKVKLLSDPSSEDGTFKLNPGDKYTIYSTNVSSNSDCLSDCLVRDPNKVDQTPRNVTIHVVSLGEDGKITYLDDSLKWVKNGQLDYYIKEVGSINQGSIQQDIDSYRSLVSSAYNIFNSKISGELALLFEVKVIDSFQVTWDATVSDQGEQKNAKIDFYVNWTSSHQDINPSYLVLSKSVLNNVTSDNVSVGNSAQVSGYSDRLNDGTDQNVKVEVGDFVYDPESSLEDCTWDYTVVPAMNFGEIPYLATSGSINFSEIGSGKMNIDEWRYYIQENNFYINLGLDAYPEINKSISKVILTFIPFEQVLNGTILLDPSSEDVFKQYDQYPQYTISGKSSYSGYFQEVINFGKNARVTNDGVLKNYLYLVDVGIMYGSEGNWEIRHNYKWLYTTGQWNQVFLDGEVSDFTTLQLTDYIDFQPTFSVEDTIEETYKNTSLGLPKELPSTNSEMNYATLGAKIATVNYNYSSYTFNSTKENVSVNIQVSPRDYKELFKFNLQTLDTFNNTISGKTISHDVFVTESDSVSAIDNYVISKVMEEEMDRVAVASALKQIDQDSAIKTEAIDNSAIDSFDATIISGQNKNQVSINVLGAIFSRINADLREAQVTVTQKIRPILLYKDEYPDLGIYNSSQLELAFGFGQMYNSGGKSAGFRCYKYNQSGTQITMEEKRDGNGDGPSYTNYWESPSYNELLNPWMFTQNCPFVPVKYSPNDYSTYWYTAAGAGNNISKKWGIWVRTDGGHYVPLHTFYNSTELSKVMKHIIMFLAQVYYVQTDPSTVQKCVVYNINKLKTFQETWNIEISSILTVNSMSKSLYLIAQNGTEISLESLVAACTPMEISTENITHSSNTLDLGHESIAHTFRLNTSDLYLEYENQKSTTIPSLWEVTTLDEAVAGGSKNANYFYAYNPNTKDMVSLNETTNCKYINLDGSINDSAADGRIRVTTSGSGGKSTALFKYLSMNSDGNLVAKESNILSKVYTYRYYPDDDEGTTIKNNSQISFI